MRRRPFHSRNPAPKRNAASATACSQPGSSGRTPKSARARNRATTESAGQRPRQNCSQTMDARASRSLPPYRGGCLSSLRSCPERRAIDRTSSRSALSAPVALFEPARQAVQRLEYSRFLKRADHRVRIAANHNLSRPARGHYIGTPSPRRTRPRPQSRRGRPPPTSATLPRARDSRRFHRQVRPRRPGGSPPPRRVRRPGRPRARPCRESAAAGRSSRHRRSRTAFPASPSNRGPLLSKSPALPTRRRPGSTTIPQPSAPTVSRTISAKSPRVGGVSSI